MPLKVDGDPGYGSIVGPGLSLSGSLGGSETLPLLIPEAVPDVNVWKPMNREQLEAAAGGPGWKKFRSRLVLFFWLGWLTILGTAVAVIVQSPRPVPTPLHWWQKELFYRLQPALFLDVDNTESSAISKVSEKLPYLQSLGVGVVILEALFRNDGSPLNLTEIDQRLGTVPEIQKLITDSQEAGVRVILDLCNLDLLNEPFLSNKTMTLPESLVQDSLRYWLEHGVSGFGICDTDPAFSEKTLREWRGLVEEFNTDYNERIVMVKKIGNSISSLNTSSLAVNSSLVDLVSKSLLPSNSHKLSAAELIEAMETKLQTLQGEWPSWTVSGHLSLQFAYRPNRSMDDTISTTLHLALTRLDNRDTYVGILFIDFSSALNTIIPQHLIGKLNLLGLNTSLSNWILDFLTGRPQSVRIGRNTSSTTTLCTGAPQDCVLSPLLFTLLTHDCAAMHSSNHIIKSADDTTVVSLISKNDESAYREEVQRLTDWCKTNNLSLNVDKTKEMVVDFRRTRCDHTPLHIDGSAVEIVKSPKFLGVHLAEDLTWSLNTSTITKKAQQRLYFLRRLRKAHLPPPILRTIESILSSCITAWFGNSTASDRKSLQRVVRTAEKIIGVSLPTITDIYTTRCIRKTTSIVDDHTHPSHTLFTLLPSGKSHWNHQMYIFGIVVEVTRMGLCVLQVDSPVPWELQKPLMVLMMTLPGTPIIRYGDESQSAVSRVLQSVASNASVYLPSDDQVHEDSIQNRLESRRSTLLFQLLSRTRSREEALLFGTFTFLSFNSSIHSNSTATPPLAFLRSWGCVHVLVLFNLGSEAHSLDPNWAPSLPEEGVFVTSTGLDRVGPVSLQAIQLRPHEAIVIKLFEPDNYF
ncbi:hypothetical protein NFI96_021740 [Prochilodus magdalenae]|nr:hypothetical protein NFI96_021740 [Prochilodus magdalenae]